MRRMRRILLSLKIAGALVAVLAVLLAGVSLLLNSSSFQNKMMKYATEILSERLGTRVTVDSISLSIIGQQFELYGVNVEDQQQRKMLQLSQLEAKVNLMALRHDEIKIRKATLRGCHALIVKADTDSVANYQFVIDSLKQKETIVGPDDNMPKKKLTLDFNNVTVEDISLQYNDNRYRLGSLSYHRNIEGVLLVEIHDVHSQWRADTKKGPVDKLASIHTLTYKDEDGLRLLTIDSLRYTTENHKPRKNKVKNKRGAFDVGHLDIRANVQATINHFSDDSLVAVVKANASDVETGINLKNINLQLATNKQTVHLHDVFIQQGRTIIKFAEGELQLPNKKEGRKLSYTITSPVMCYVVLQDISKPFAPVLNKFTLPLHLMLHLSGDDNSMKFRNVQVSTPDKNLIIKASGMASNLKVARELVLRFNVSDMYVRGGCKEKIISQFPVKKMMMKQLHMLGDIDYTGNFAVLWRKEQFSGQLRTQVGKLNFQFTIDESNKYVFGSAQSDALQVSKTFDLPDIGVAKCKSDFKVDISKPRTAKMRKLKGGKLPIGTASIQVDEVSYKGIKVRNVSLNVNSDGALAEGSLKTNGRHIDLSCNFSFTSTDEMKKMKITKPGIKWHKLSDDDRQKKAEEKALKKQEKEARKQQKADQRKQQRAEREQQRAERKLQRAERKKQRAERKKTASREKGG